MKNNLYLNNIAIIPARKNSVRIKNKNIKIFNGKPIIYWSIKTALKSKLFSKIFVSTDSLKIKKIAELSGAETLFPRPKNISGQNSSIMDVINFEVKRLKKKINFKNICCIFPTAVFLKSKNLKNGLKLLSKNTDYVFSAIKDEKSVLKNFFFYKKKLNLIQSKYKSYNTQNLPFTYKDAGQFYWGSKKNWLVKKNIFSENSKIVILNSKKIIDLDTKADWNKMKSLKNE